MSKPCLPCFCFFSKAPHIIKIVLEKQSPRVRAAPKREINKQTKCKTKQNKNKQQKQTKPTCKQTKTKPFKFSAILRGFRYFSNSKSFRASGNG